MAALKTISKRLSDSRAKMLDVKNQLDSRGFEKLFKDGFRIGSRVS